MECPGLSPVPTHRDRLHPPCMACCGGDGDGDGAPATTWTFVSLVGAFLDLAIAYLLLCSSLLAFLAARFLSFFGLRLPCPCATGLFGAQDGCGGRACPRRLLLDGPLRRIGSVQVAVKSRFPYDLLLTADDHDGGGGAGRRIGCGPQVQLLEMGDEGQGEGKDVAEEEEQEEEMQGTSSRAILMIRDDSEIGSGSNCPSASSTDGLARSSRSTGKSKRRSRQRKASSSRQFAQLDWEVDDHRPSASENAHKEKREPSGEENSDASTSTNCSGQCFLLNHSHVLPLEDAPFDSELNLGMTEGEAIGSGVMEGEELDTVRVLEKALKEEQAARFALLLELDKERNAAASAADEAMAMIERLQKEKAMIEMSSRQYQRMIEEKSVYDEEEMGLLRDIILKREKELYVLGKEVEMYKQMMGSDEMSEQIQDSSFEEEDDTSVMLQHISDSIEKKKPERHDDKILARITSIVQNIPRSSDSDSHQLEAIPYFNGRLEYQEKDVVSSCKSDGVQELDSHQRQNMQDAEGNCQNSYNPHLEVEPSILDVHVISDDVTPSTDINEKEIDFQTNDDSVCSQKCNLYFESCKTKNIEVSSDTSSVSSAEKLNMCRSQSSANFVRHIDKSPPTTGSPYDSNKNLLFVVDGERLELENEIEELRRRLKLVQQSRKRLNFSLTHMEKENIQLQLLEEIASQLQEIRQITDPGQPIRQSSLPPPSKGHPKKRSSRSASWGSMEVAEKR